MYTLLTPAAALHPDYHPAPYKHETLRRQQQRYCYGGCEILSSFSRKA